MANTDSIKTGSILISTMSRGNPIALVYEVVAKTGDTVSLQPIEWSRYTATVKEVTIWGALDPVIGKRGADKTRNATRTFGRPAKGKRSGPTEDMVVEHVGKFGQLGVEWPERKERAYLYHEGTGYPAAAIRNRAADPKDD